MIESPCIGVCMINGDEERCYGCYRTLDEIARWASFSAAERGAIMNQLAARRDACDPWHTPDHPNPSGE